MMFSVNDSFVCFLFLIVVIFYCHSSAAIMDAILFTAQDMDMTNGDYSFFVYNDMPEDITTPWSAYNLSGSELEYRITASYAVKLV
jgi:hypothetical protein